MINQTTNSVNNNVFAPFISKNGVNYAISKPFTPEQKEEFEAKKNTKTHKLGVNIAATSLLAGFGVLALMKGMPKGSYEKFNRLFVNLGNKISKKESKNLTIVESLKLQILKIARLTAGLIKSSYNIGLKDILVKKTLTKLPFGAKFENGITNLFRKISIKTLTRSYANTSANFEHMFAELDKVLPEKLEKTVEINGVSKKASEWVKELTNKIRINRDAHFSETATNKRLETVSKNIENLYEDVWNRFRDVKKLVRNKSTYQTFIAEELASPAKLKLAQDVDVVKQIISHDINDNYNSAKKLLSNIDSKINPTDAEAQKLINKIGEQLKEYKSLSGVVEAERRPELNKEITATLEELTSYLGKNGSKIENYVAELNNTLSTSKKGAIQQMLTVYKQTLPKEEYLAIKKEIYKAVKSFNKSTDMETDLLFDKLRDLKLGSAPSDALSILASLGVVGWGLGKADNKDEKVSVALKYGIPVVGSVATTLYCTARLVSGGKAIIFGLLSGIAINKIGEMIDDARKKYNKNPILLNQLKFPELKLPDLGLSSSDKS